MSISGVTNLQTDWGNEPRIIRMTTTDTYSQITAPNYLNNSIVMSTIAGLQNTSGTFQWLPDDYVLIAYGDGEGFFTVDNTVDFTFLPGGSNREVLTGVTSLVTLSQFLDNDTAPVEIVAPSPGLITIVDSWAFQWAYGSAALADGGAIGLQYGNTASLGGIAASNTMAANTLTGTASFIQYSAGGVLASQPWTNVENVGIYLSNASGHFTGGTGGYGALTVWYHQIAPGY